MGAHVFLNCLNEFIESEERMLGSNNLITYPPPPPPVLNIL